MSKFQGVPGAPECVFCFEAYCFGRPDPNARYFRRVYYEAKAADVPGFKDGFRKQEKAIIELRSKFAPSEGSNVASSGNGVSRTVEARQGVSPKATVPVMPRVPLRLFRTFQEVDQPESEFLLQLDDEGNVGLFEAEGGMCKLRARETVKAFLENALEAETAAGEVYIAL